MFLKEKTGQRPCRCRPSTANPERVGAEVFVRSASTASVSRLRAVTTLPRVHPFIPALGTSALHSLSQNHLARFWQARHLFGGEAEVVGD